MIDLIAEMFFAPEAHESAYDWASALLSHAMIGMALTAVFGWVLGAWRGAAVVAFGYAFLWEGGQLLFANADLSDSAIDALAVLCGSMIAAAAWRHHGRAVAVAMVLLSVTLWQGVARRK